MRVRDRSRQAPANLRLVAEGTRVVLLRGGAKPPTAGTISSVRPQTNLKTYVVTCDDGVVVFASGYDLAREGDALARPLGASPHDAG